MEGNHIIIASPRFNPIGTSITTTSAGAWVIRTVTAGPNKMLWVKVQRGNTGPIGGSSGVRSVGSPNTFSIQTKLTTQFVPVQTDNNSQIEIFATGTGYIFTEYGTLT
jgi:hypothetical protein